MATKRVLVVSFDFAPQGGTGAIRVTKFVKYLPEFGWQPIVVASDTMWNPDESLSRDVPADVPVYRVPWLRWLKRGRAANAPAPAGAAPVSSIGPGKASTLRDKLARIVRRMLVPDAQVLWVREAERTCRQILAAYPCDAMLTTSPPNSVHLVGRRLRLRTGVPWVADFRDAWTAENPALRRLGRLHWMRQRRRERQVLAVCDRALMVTEPLTRQTQDVFPDAASKCLTITNGFDPQDFAGPAPALDNERFVIAYVGTVLGTQAENAFPEGLRLAVEQSRAFRSQVSVRFTGQLAPEYQARLAGLEDVVEVGGFVTHDAAVDAMRRAHVLLLVLPDNDLGRMTFTNKFFEYVAARRPILALAPVGVISAIINGDNMGSVVPPDDTAAIARALLTMFDAVGAHPDGACPSEATLARFDRRELTRRLASVLDEIASV